MLIERADRVSGRPPEKAPLPKHGSADLSYRQSDRFNRDYTQNHFGGRSG